MRVNNTYLIDCSLCEMYLRTKSPADDMDLGQLNSPPGSILPASGINHAQNPTCWCSNFHVRVSTGAPGYGLCTEMIQKFFSISIMEKFPENQNSRTISRTIFFRKTENSGTLFWNIVPEIFRKFPEQLVP